MMSVLAFHATIVRVLQRDVLGIVDPLAAAAPDRTASCATSTCRPARWWRRALDRVCRSWAASGSARASDAVGPTPAIAVGRLATPARSCARFRACSPTWRRSSGAWSPRPARSRSACSPTGSASDGAARSCRSRSWRCRRRRASPASTARATAGAKVDGPTGSRYRRGGRPRARSSSCVRSAPRWRSPARSRTPRRASGTLTIPRALVAHLAARASRQCLGALPASLERQPRRVSRARAVGPHATVSDRGARRRRRWSYARERAEPRPSDATRASTRASVLELPWSVSDPSEACAAAASASTRPMCRPGAPSCAPMCCSRSASCCWSQFQLPQRGRHDRTAGAGRARRAGRAEGARRDGRRVRRPAPPRIARPSRSACDAPSRATQGRARQWPRRWRS